MRRPPDTQAHVSSIFGCYDITDRKTATTECVQHTHLRQKWKDGNASMAANDGYIDRAKVEPLLLSNECVGTHNVKRGDAHQAPGVIHTGGLEHLGRDGDGRVYRV